MKEGKTEGKTEKQKEIQAIGIRNTSATLLCSQKSEANAPMSRSRGEVMCKSKMATFFHGALRALPATPGGPGGPWGPWAGPSHDFHRSSEATSELL